MPIVPSGWSNTEGTMSTASRDCGSACGTRARSLTQASVPGVTPETRGYYGPRATGQLGRIYPPPGERSGPDDNTAPPGYGLRQPDQHRRGPATPCRPRMSLVLMPYFPIGLREPRLRHSPPPFFSTAPPFPRSSPHPPFGHLLPPSAGEGQGRSPFDIPARREKEKTGHVPSPVRSMGEGPDRGMRASSARRHSWHPAPFRASCAA
jgi:hypothetical protein